PSTYFTNHRVGRRVDFMDAGQCRELLRQGKPGAMDCGYETSWLDQVTLIPLSQVYNVSVKGGRRTSNYIASINYRDAEGIIKKSNNQMLYPRLEVNHSMFNDRIKLNANISGYEQKFFSGTDGGSYRGDVYRN